MDLRQRIYVVDHRQGSKQVAYLVFLSSEDGQPLLYLRMQIGVSKTYASISLSRIGLQQDSKNFRTAVIELCNPVCGHYPESESHCLKPGRNIEIYRGCYFVFNLQYTTFYVPGDACLPPPVFFCETSVLRVRVRALFACAGSIFPLPCSALNLSFWASSSAC
jgi:hypothetical protein